MLTPIKAIRKYCLDCMNGSSLEVRECPSTDCPLYEYRFGKRPGKSSLTPAKAIKAKCLDCSGYQPKERKECSLIDCPLWQYRLGHNPKLKGKGNAYFLQKNNVTTNDLEQESIK